MIKLLIILIPLIPINIVIGQNLSLDQLLTLRTKPLAIVEEYLTSRNWEMLNSAAETDNSLGSIDFTYKKTTVSDQAESFIKYIYKISDSSSNRIEIQVNTLNKYNNYIARLKAMGFILRKTEVKTGEIIKVYTGKGVAVKVSSLTHKNEFVTSTTYSFFICEINYYYIQWGW